MIFDLRFFSPSFFLGYFSGRLVKIIDALSCSLLVSRISFTKSKLRSGVTCYSRVSPLPTTVLPLRVCRSSTENVNLFFPRRLASSCTYHHADKRSIHEKAGSIALRDEITKKRRSSLFAWLECASPVYGSRKNKMGTRSGSRKNKSG